MHNIDTTRLLKDFHEVIEQTEQLLRATASEAGERVSATRAATERSLQAAKRQLHSAEREFLGRARHAARAADRAVHERPWVAIAASAVLGFAVGVLASRR